MKYLNEYGLSDEEIKSLEDTLIDTDLFTYEVDKVMNILNLFRDIGVNNYYGLISIGHEMFYDTVNSIKRRIDEYGNKDELARLINEDAHNLVLADLI